MEALIIFILLFLFSTSAILQLNRREFTPLIREEKFDQSEKEFFVSICIPARNESQTIKRCVESLLNQSYGNMEILVLDDGSTDGTGEILRHLAAQHPALLQILQGDSKPDHWLGKPWACHQLAEKAGGNILIFADADTWFTRHTVRRVAGTLNSENIDMLTIWPMQKLETFWEKTVIPLVYHALLTLLPARYVYRDPRWLPPSIRRALGPLFAAACGQFMAFRTECYEAIGGHKSVKSVIVEDVELARQVKRAGLKMKMFHGRSAVSCRMYTGREELKMGFRKNFLAGFNYRVPLFVLMGLLHIFVFIVPMLGAPYYAIFGQPLLAIGFGVALLLIFFQRYLLARWFDWNRWYGLLHPVGVLWFIRLAAISLVDYYLDRSVMWKERPVNQHFGGETNSKT